MIVRDEYLDRLKMYREKQLIKVVTGVRRCGKTTLFNLYKEYLKSTGVTDDQIVSVNLENFEYENLLDYKALYHYVKERLHKEKYTYVFIDEVQYCKHYEKAVNSLFIKPRVDLYINGSTENMLLGEFTTLLSGRYVTIHMLPFSFREYCRSPLSEHNTPTENFHNFLRYGSFPYVSTLARSNAVITPYLEGIYHTILLNDVASRANITDIPLLECILKYLAKYNGNLVSTKSISDYINSSGRRISVNTVDLYLKALTDSFIIYKTGRFDIKGKKHLKTFGKYYFVDTGIRNILLPGSSSDIGLLIENVVYLELLRRGMKVNIGKLADREVDFVAFDRNELTYYQVSESVLDQSTLQRELEPLQKISDNYSKVLLTLDEIGTDENFDGIRHVNLLDWLLNS